MSRYLNLGKVSVTTEIATATEMDGALSKITGKIIAQAAQRQEQWLDACMKRLMPASVYAASKDLANKRMAMRWIKRHKISIQEHPNGDKWLMKGDERFSVLKAFKFGAYNGN